MARLIRCRWGELDPTPDHTDRDREEAVVIRRGETGDDRPAAGPKNAPHLGECLPPIGAVNNAQPGQRYVERAVRKLQPFGIHDPRREVAHAASPGRAIGEREDAGGQVGGQYRAGRAHPLGGSQARLAGACRHVDDLIARSEAGHDKHGFGDRAQPGG